MAPETSPNQSQSQEPESPGRTQQTVQEPLDATPFEELQEAGSQAGQVALGAYAVGLRDHNAHLLDHEQRVNEGNILQMMSLGLTMDEIEKIQTLAGGGEDEDDDEMGRGNVTISGDTHNHYMSATRAEASSLPSPPAQPPAHIAEAAPAWQRLLPWGVAGASLLAALAAFYRPQPDFNDTDTDTINKTEVKVGRPADLPPITP